MVSSAFLVMSALASLGAWKQVPEFSEPLQAGAMLRVMCMLFHEYFVSVDNVDAALAYALETAALQVIDA